MFARLMIGQMNIDKMDDGRKVYAESIIPAAKSQKGYHGAYLLSDRKTGKAVSITLWDSEEVAIANEQSGYLQEQVGKLKEFLTAPPVREGYEVSVQDLK